MPLDVRKLIFNDQELRLAFQTYVKDQKLHAVEMVIESVTIVDPQKATGAPANGFTAVLDFATKNLENPQRLILQEKQILEAMISMCRGLRIPLPRKGQKYLQENKGSLALTIGLSENDIRDYMSVSNDASAPTSTPQAQNPASQETKSAAKVARRD